MSRLFAIVVLAWAAPFALAAPPPDALIQDALRAMQANRFDDARRSVDEALLRAPNFRLAHLIRGDLLAARARPLRALGDIAAKSKQALDDLRAEAIARAAAATSPPQDDQLPRALLRLSPEQRHALVVDTTRSRLYVFARDDERPRLVADYYVSSGKNGAAKQREGDQKTPVGAYIVSRRVKDTELDDFYGSGAFPLNYPNAWDRLQRRNGHGIWLHGTPRDTYSRPPRASDGCVVLANPELQELAAYVDVGKTPVVIGAVIDWLPREDWLSERDALLSQIEAWRSDWERLEFDKYAAHYAKSFGGSAAAQARWRSHKRGVFAGKTWSRVELRNISALRHPGEEVAVVSFEQHYSSNNLTNRMHKRLYWIKEAGVWKIALEGELRSPSPRKKGKT
jgi:murein L,D-transpeptidase YafK